MSDTATKTGKRRKEKRASSDNTRDKIIDAAERLFGERTFDTVSLRDITQRAEVTLALASYHFGTKENLFSDIVARRAKIIGDQRREKLAELQASGNLSTKSIVDAFMHPLFDRMMSGDEGWRYYLLILAQLGQTNRWLNLLHDNFDETAEMFLEQLRKTLPQVDDTTLVRGFSMILVSMLQTLASNRRLDTLSDGKASASDLEAAYPVLLQFVVRGLEGLADL